MSKILNLKVLLIMFGVLAVAVIAILLAEGNKPERTFKSELFTVDTAKVTSIVITPKEKQKGDISLKKENNQWKLDLGNKQIDADNGMISGILSQLTQLKPERVAARDKSKWKDFQVTDSASTRVQVKQGEELTADFLIGKFSTRQSRQQNHYQQPQYSMTTYVRLNGEEEVYAIDGFLSMSFNRSIEDFRNKTILKADKNDLTKLTFSYPGDSSFTVSKQNNKWMLGGVLADSVKMVSYLGSITRLNSSNFIEKPAVELSEPVFSVVVEGNNINPVEINAFPADTINKYYIRSSVNPDAVFSSANEGIAEKLFVGKAKLQ